MRIAFLNAYGNGSTGRIVDQLKLLCERNGDTVISYYARESCQRSDHTTVRTLNKFDFYIDGLLTRIFDNHGLNSWWSTRSIIRGLKKFSPDIVHIHNLHGYWINYPMLFAYLKDSGVRVVWTFHDCWHITGHCTHFDFIGCDKWKIQCHNCPQLNEYPSSSFCDGSKRNFLRKKECFCSIPKKMMTIVTPSEWLGLKVKESFLGGYNIKVINNGIDTSIFNPSKDTTLRNNILREGYKHIILGIAATWNERKGLSDIIEVAKIHNDWFFVIIGNIPEHSNADVNLVNIKHINRTENICVLRDWYSCADVFVNPTLEDTYPTTNLESIACSTPIVTYATGGSEEIVRKSGFGEVTKERNSKCLESSIIKVLSQNYTVAEDFNLDAKQKFAEYMNLYNQLLKR